MSTKEQLIEQHIREYNSKLKHIDEVTDKAAVAEGTEHHEEWAELKAERDKLAHCLAEMEHKTPEGLVEAAGPMAIWDVVAQRLENLVEKIHK